MNRFLVYNFSGELDAISHLFPNERLACIAAVIMRQGKEAAVLDRANFADFLRIGPAFLKNLGSLSFHDSNGCYERALQREAQYLLDQHFDCIFINLWHGTGFKFSADLAKVLKTRSPDLIIYGIGQKVDWFAEHILKLTNGHLDGLITGLGYNAIERIVSGEDYRGIPNMIVPSGTDVVVNPKVVVDPNDYPCAAYDASVYLDIQEKIPVYSLTLSNQACANKCAFCVRPENYGRTVRGKSTDRIMNELEDLALSREITHFRVEDSTPPRNALTELAEAIVTGPLAGRITLSAFSRIDVNSTEDFSLLKRAGFISLFFGLESLDDDNLVRLRKGFTYDAIRQTLEKAHAAGIRTVGSFIFPTPGETRESMERTLRRILELRPILDSVLVLPAGVHPTTEWGRNPENYGIKLTENYIEESIIYPIKYEVPLEHWRPLPFTYRLMGHDADEVTFTDIARVNREFTSRIKDKFRMPRIPDINFLIAHLLNKDPAGLSKDLVGLIMRRDYAGLQAFFRNVGNSAKDMKGVSRDA